MKSATLLALLVLSFHAMAEEVRMKVVRAVKSANFEIGIGSQVELNFVQSNKVGQAIFLGRMLGHEQFKDEMFFLDERKTRIYMVDTKSIRTTATKSRAQNLISTIDQAGETCAAYALYHFWIQSAAVGLKGNGTLYPVATSQMSRMKLLEESITRYYMGRSFDIKPIMKEFGSRFGFTCKERKFTTTAPAMDYVFTQASMGRPVIMEFYIGNQMVTSDFEIQDYETKVELDPRLWTPRRIGIRNAGGHAIVAAGAFISQGRRKLMVLDSNWNEPRVWDVENYLGGKTAISEMIFHHCE